MMDLHWGHQTSGVFFIMSLLYSEGESVLFNHHKQVSVELFSVYLLYNKESFSPRVLNAQGTRQNESNILGVHEPCQLSIDI